MSVRNVDFGKSKNEAARAFARLIGILEERSADILIRPEHYLQLAMDEIEQHRSLIRRAQDALRMSPLEYMPKPEEPVRYIDDTIRVPLSEYRRLLACAAIVRDCVR